MSTPRLVPYAVARDLLPQHRNTSIENLLAYHNLGVEAEPYDGAQIVVAMCMDHRKRLRVPDRFAFVIRTAGVYLSGLEFQLSFAVGVGGVGAIALIGHDDCGMSRLTGLRESFADGMVRRAGWTREEALRHYDESVEPFAIGDPITSVADRARALATRYPKVPVAPLLYKVGDGLLYQIDS